MPEVLALLGQPAAGRDSVVVKPMETTFYLGRETLIPMGKGKAPPSPAARVETMGRWRKLLFAMMTRNAQSATAYFNLPPNRVVELGAQLQF